MVGERGGGGEKERRKPLHQSLCTYYPNCYGTAKAALLRTSMGSGNRSSHQPGNSASSCRRCPPSAQPILHVMPPKSVGQILHTMQPETAGQTFRVWIGLHSSTTLTHCRTNPSSAIRLRISKKQTFLVCSGLYYSTTWIGQQSHQRTQISKCKGQSYRQAITQCIARSKLRHCHRCKTADVGAGREAGSSGATHA